MNSIWSAVVGLALAAGLRATASGGEAGPPIPAAEARKAIGTNAVIVGRVVEVHRTEKVVRLNFGAKFPDQVFTAVVFERSFGVFTNLDAVVDREVRVRGKVTEYRGRPQIILNTSDQLEVLPRRPAPPGGLRIVRPPELRAAPAQ
jgi:hypothetical protein